MLPELKQLLTIHRAEMDWHANADGCRATCGIGSPARQHCEECCMGNRTMVAPRPSAIRGARLTGRATVKAIGNAQVSSRSTAIILPLSAIHQGPNMAGDWPLRTSLELGALPSAVPCARLHAKHVLREWGLETLSESVELLVSELLTNAVKAARAMEPISPVRFWVWSDHSRVLIQVWDANPQPPVRIDVTDDAENGRGLLLVEAISQQWNWYLTRETGGKVAWCLVAG